MKKLYFASIILLIYFFFAGQSAFADIAWPSVKVDISPKFLVQPGQEITLRAAHTDFSMSEADKTKLHFNWCIDDVPLHGKIAGSDDKITGVEGGYYLENKFGKVEGGRGACHINDYSRADIIGAWVNAGRHGYTVVDPPAEFFMTRTPTNPPEDTSDPDSDNDGLDDDWELRYFGGRRKPDTTPAEYYPSVDDKEALLDAVKPGDDPDKDGFEYTYTDYFTPLLPFGEGGPVWSAYIWSVPWTIGIPYVKSSTSTKLPRDSSGFYRGEVIGDKKFTNLEEYTAGTNPLVADTDTDGITDELDFAGNQQDQFVLRVNKDWGGKYDVRLFAFGVTQKWKDNHDAWKYMRADFPNKNTEEGREKTPDGANIITVGEGLPMQTNIGYSPAPPLSGEQVQVTAEALQLTELKGLDVFFRWFLDGVQQKSKEEGAGTKAGGGEGVAQSGFGKKTFQFVASKNPCDRHIVGVEIVENKTGKMNYNEIEIPVGFNVAFNKTVLGNADLRNDVTQQFNLRTGSATPISDFLLPNDQMKDEISGDIGYRQGDVVQVTANNLDRDFNATLCGADNFDEFLKNLTFLWNFKGREQQTQSGVGQNFMQATFVLRGGSRAPKEGSGTSAGNTMESSSEYINLEIKDKNGGIIARKREELKIIPPYIDLTVEGADLATSGDTTNKQRYQAFRGANIKITAKLHYFRPSKGFTYTWKRNGETVNEMKDTDVTTATYSFKAGIKPDGESTNLDKDEIALAVVNKINTSNTNEKEFGNNNLTIEIVTTQPVVPGGVVGAALEKFIPRYYKSVFNLALGGALMGMVTLLVLGFMRGTERK